MTRSMRAAALRGFAGLVDELGGDGTSLLQRHGIAPEVVAAEDGMVAVRAINQVLEAAAAELDRPDFGLLLADRQDASVLGPLAAAITVATTVADAVAAGCRFVSMHSPDLSMAIEPDPLGQRGVVAIVYRNAFVDSDYSPQAIEVALAAVHRVAQLVHGGDYPLRSVLVSHDALSPVSRYVEFFGTDVRFGCADAALRVPERILARPVPGGNQLLHDLAIAHLEASFSPPGCTLTDRVREVISGTIGTASSRVDVVAGLLLMHPRTLQRRLAAEGATFEAILDEVRRRTAHRIIVETDLSLRHVAALVGLAEQATLTRAVRRWFGLTPSALRRSGGVLPEADEAVSGSS